MLSCPQLVKAWADADQPDQATLIKAIKDIEVYAQYRPQPTVPEYQWWVNALSP